MTEATFHRSDPAVQLPGMLLRDHWFNLPLDHHGHRPGRIEVFAREVIAPSAKADTPWLVFLQGGPGCESPRPPASASWLPRALQEYRVLLLDQRGTGRSSRLDTRAIEALGSPAAQAEYLTHFRADAIVADCELIRHQLLDGARWSVLGQSFGGFCATHYLSAAPAGLREVFITGGLPPLTGHADDVYRRTYALVRAKNERYYERYPQDVDRVRRIVRHLAEHDVRMPDGARLTARRFLQLGMNLGMSDGFETIHYLVEDAFVAGPDGAEIHYAFMKGVENGLSFQSNPLFAIIHEACYGQADATRWSAHRILAEFPEFEIDPAAGRPILFTGEMVFPWMFDDYPRLAPLKDAAQRLAECDWPRLYDPARLASNEVASAAAVYHDDMYVDRELSLATARNIRGLRVWITNEFEHNGLRTHGERVLGRLIELVRGQA